jgi:agmatine deiminase
MQKLLTVPAADGFAMPAEFLPHAGTILIWPVRPGSWGTNPQAAQEAFLKVSLEIARGEEVYLLAGPEQFKTAQAMLQEALAEEAAPTAEKAVCNQAVTSGSFRENTPAASQAPAPLYPIQVLPLPSDDAWARDCGPTFVTKTEEAAPGSASGETGSLTLNPSSHPGRGRTLVRGISWKFNAWGGTYDGLYPHWEQDDALAEAFCDKLGYNCYDAGDFVLEGGSIHTDGEGTLLVTASCLLSPGRNPQLSQAQIEAKLKAYLGVEKILWLPDGIYNDETNGHIDNVCCFIRPGEIVLAWTDNQADPQYELSHACLDYLQKETDARGRRLVIHKLPIPEVPICFTEEDCRQMTFADGEDTRQPGERLAASYVNFYFSNAAVLVPQFGGVNQKSDALALALLQRLLPERKVIGLPARVILLGGGNLHCITQQVPQGEKA